MKDEVLYEIYQTLGEIKGTQEQILAKINRMCEVANDHETRIDKIEKTQERHKTYFRLIGGALASLIVSFLPKAFDAFNRIFRLN